MKYSFNEKIDRTGNHAAKWEEMGKKFISDDLWPMWIADMDLKTAPEIIEAMREKVEQGIFGYVYRPDSYYQAAADWLERRFGYKIDPATLINSPGVVPTLSLLVRSMTKPGEKILIQSPVYYPFAATIRDNGREVVENKLVKDDEGYYTIDFEDFEKKVSDESIGLFIMCSPHNPVGRVWTKEELTRIGTLCLQYGVTILSDEIHSDLALFGHKHVVIASLSPEIAAITVTMMAPSKTFNIAGMMNSVVVISNPELRRPFEKELLCLHLDLGNIFGHVTLEAAYKHGDAWLDEMVRYLEKNILFTDQFLQEELPAVKMILPEGSFLLWLDFRATGLSHEQIQEKLLHEAKVGLNSGMDFGPDGEGFFRMNIGCPLETVKEGFERLKKTFK